MEDENSDLLFPCSYRLNLRENHLHFSYQSAKINTKTKAKTNDIMTNCRLQLFEIVDNFQKKIISKNKVTSILFQFFIDLALSEEVLSHANVFF